MNERSRGIVRENTSLKVCSTDSVKLEKIKASIYVINKCTLWLKVLQQLKIEKMQILYDTLYLDVHFNHKLCFFFFLLFQITL